MTSSLWTFFLIRTPVGVGLPGTIFGKFFVAVTTFDFFSLEAFDLSFLEALDLSFLEAVGCPSLIILCSTFFIVVSSTISGVVLLDFFSRSAFYNGLNFLTLFI